MPIASVPMTGDGVTGYFQILPGRTIEDVVGDLVDAFRDRRLPDSMTDDRYYNVKMMQRLQLT